MVQPWRISDRNGHSFPLYQVDWILDGSSFALLYPNRLVLTRVQFSASKGKLQCLAVAVVILQS
jgi:hypothetical protein